MARVTTMTAATAVLLLVLGTVVPWSGLAAPGVAGGPYVVQPRHWDTFHGKADRLYLTGPWKFNRAVNVLEQRGGKLVASESVADPGTDVGIEKGYFRPEFDDTGWDELPVPWVWNEPVRVDARADPRSSPFAGVGYFRTRFLVPADRRSKRVFLCFTSVQTACRVWVNGKLVGQHANSESAAGPSYRFLERLWLDDFELDVSEHVTFGAENVVAVRVYDDGLPIMYNRYPDGGGICGPVTVDFREPVYASEVLVDPDIHTGEIAVDMLFRNCEDAPRILALQARVEPFVSEFYRPRAEAPAANVGFGQVRCPPGDSRHRFTISVPDPVRWDVDNPVLYLLRVTADDRVLGQTRFGFRRFEVRGRRFLLNDQPIYVLGTNPGDNWNRRPQINCFNKANSLRLGLRLYKEANINFVRVHNGPRTRIFYDICDELGLIVQNDFSPRYANLKKEQIKRAELIEQAHVDAYIGPDGRLTEDFRNLLRRWFARLYNHPSNCMFTAGNELGHHLGVDDALVAAYANGFYAFLKQIDGQKRPVTPSSGLAVWEWHVPLKADYFDHHTYVDGDAGWADCVTGNMRRARDWERIYGKSLRDLDRPVINGECVGYQTRSCYGRKPIRELFVDGELDKTKYVQWVNMIAKDQKRSIGYWDWGAQRWYVRWAGVRSLTTLADAERATADLAGRMVHMLRRDMDFLQGFFLHDLCPRHFGFDYGRYAANEAEMLALYEQAKGHVEFQALRRTLAPQLVTLDMYDRHWFAGDTFQTSLHVINDAFADDGKGYAVDLALEAPDGKVVDTVYYAFDSVPANGRAMQPVVLPLGETLPAGDYCLRLRLRKAGRIVNEQQYPLLIASPARASAMAGQRRVALYDTAETVFKGLDTAATHPILTDLGVPFTRVHDLTGLTDFDLLIIGANSIDQRLMNQAESLRTWIERGGWVLCLEQVYAGPVPFLSEMRLQYCGNMFTADVIAREHPSVRGTRPWHWELWNGQREKTDSVWDAGPKRVYDTYLLPMADGVVVAGGPRAGGWTRNLVFGMIVAEVKAGKGQVLFSQALAVRRYGRDAVATQYLRDLLRYVLGDEWRGEYAAPVSGRRVKFLDRTRCFSVDLRPVANRSFSDEVDGDRQGGWTDQGRNDLRRIPRGDVMFMGVPYSVLDDADGSPTCLVLAGKARPYFPKVIEGIRVDRRASRLHFLHAVAWGGKASTKVGEYRIRYEDGNQEIIDLVTGENIGEWWSPADVSQAGVAWSDRNAAGAMVGLYDFAWLNPHPTKKLATITFSSGASAAVPALVAITGVTE